MNYLKKSSVFLVLLLLIAIAFMACSTDESMVPVENQGEALESEDINDDQTTEAVAQENETMEETTERTEKNESESSHEDDSDENITTLDEKNEGYEGEEDSENEVVSSDPSSDEETSDEESSQETNPVHEENNPESKATQENMQAEVNELKIKGSVEKPLTLSLDELKAMEDLGYSETFYSLNSFGTTEYTDFKGIKLWPLLQEKAHILEGAETVKIVAIDGYNVSFTINEVKRSDYIDETNQNLQLPIIIAWEENGEAYNPKDGPPYKLVIGQKEPGDINKPQWVRDIDAIIVE
jgi:DMSO/TMAO reductase YedYZ molybdopterin-dependent catalytic subunit